MKRFALLIASLLLSMYTYAENSIVIPNASIERCTDKVLLDSIEKKLQNDFTKHELSREELNTYKTFSENCLTLLKNN